MAEEKAANRAGQDDGEAQEAVPTITGAPADERKPGHQINQAGSDPVNRRMEGDGWRNDQPQAHEGQQAPPPTPAESIGAPANTAQADQRKDSGR